jgi:NAD-dependent dihydropyrimidine dehydrogenase PreA subunit
MPFVIAKPCEGVKDAACVAVCPVHCIRPDKAENEFGKVPQLYINPQACIECGLCVHECPVRAVYHQAGLPPQWAEYIEKNARHFGVEPVQLAPRRRNRRLNEGLGRRLTRS